MAEGPDPVAKSVHELEQEITCGICHEQYKEPKIFPCCHYYCRQCIIALARRYKSNKPFPCPDCREPTVLPENNPDKLPTAFFINRMKEVHSRMEKAHGKVEALCEMCSGGGKAVAFCRQCTHFICDECVNIHRKVKVYARHTISTLEELKQGGAQDLNLEEAPPPMCKIHEEAKKLYCFDCSQLICRDCIVIDHAGHKYEFVKKAAPETKKKLAEYLTPLKELESNLQHAVERVRERKTAVEVNGRSITEQANVLFKEAFKIIENRRKQLLTESTKMVQSKVKNLAVQDKGISISLGTVQSLVDFVERALLNASDEEVMTMHDGILSRVKSEIKKQKQGNVSLDPVEENDIRMEVSLADSLKDIRLTKVHLLNLEGDPLRCTAEGDGMKNAEVGKIANVTVKLFLPNGLATTKLRQIILELKSLVDKSVIRVQGVHVHRNMYSVEYTPKVRGRHQLTITVNDKPIRGSPFPVFVKINPSELGEPVRVIKGVTSPMHIAFNSSENVIVTEWNRDVVVMNKNGTTLRRIKKSEHNFNYLVGVTVDTEDNIYVVNNTTRNKQLCLYKFHKEGKLLKKAGAIGSQLSSPRGLTVFGDRLLVCDSSNSRLQVYTKQLEYVNQIGSKGSGNGQFNDIEDIAADKQGNLYITDQSNDRIQILNSGGKFLRSIGVKTGKPVLLEGVCVDDKYIYVVDLDGEIISVFSQDGQYVTSFGKGVISDHAYGIAIDNDAFIYVCDNSANQIIVF